MLVIHVKTTYKITHMQYKLSGNTAIFIFYLHPSLLDLSGYKGVKFGSNNSSVLHHNSDFNPIIYVYVCCDFR